MKQLKRFTRWLYVPVINQLLRLLTWIAPKLPRWFLHKCSFFFASVCFLTLPSYRRVIIHNMSIVHPSLSDHELWELAFKSVRNFARYFADLFHFPGLPPEKLHQYIAGMEHGEIIIESLKKGKGVLLATAHLGNWEMGGFLLADRNYPINIVYVKDRFSGIEQHRSRMRNRANVNEIAIGESVIGALPVLKALRRNEIIGLQIDRDVTGKGMSIDFANGKFRFPTGPALLSLLSGAPILPAFILFTPDYRYRAIIEQPIMITPSGDREKDIRSILEQVAQVIERYVRNYPDQWYCFYKFFED